MFIDSNEVVIEGPNGEPLFTKGELADRGNGGFRLKPGFSEALKQLRTELNEPMIVTSGCRSKARNAFVGGARNSFHIYNDSKGGTMAVDIRTETDEYALKLVSIAARLGWSIGVYPTWIHLDRRDLLSKNKKSVLFCGRPD